MNKVNDFEAPAELPELKTASSSEVPTEQSTGGEHAYEIAAEKGAPTQSPLLPPQQTVIPSASVVPSQPQSTPLTNISTSSSALIADDTDLIEKEWITKAKAIVEQTKHDPFVQNNELSKVKADYVKKRYNKDLKLKH